MKNTILLYLLIAANLLHAQDAWRKIGDIAPEAGYNSASSIAIDSFNVPYVAYADLGLAGSSPYNGVTVKKFNGTSWVPVGQRAYSGNTYVSGTEIAINHQNIPYVAYSIDPTGSNYVHFNLDKFNGSGWDNLYQRTGTSSNFNAITIDRNNVPFFACNTDMNTFTMSISSIGGSAGINNSLVGYQPDFAIDNNNILYIVYRAASNRACVQRYNGSSWEFVGPSTGISVNLCSGTRIAIDHNNVPYIVYKDEAISSIEVKKFNGTSWDLVGTSGFPGPCDFPDIAIDNNNIPYVSYNDFLNFNNTAPHYLGMTVQKFNGTAWVVVGQPTFSTINAISIGTHLVFGKNNVVYAVTDARVSGVFKTEAYYFGPPTFPAITLPVRLLSFEATAQQETVVINWSTASELNNDFFTIEKSQDGASFIELARINAGNNSNAVQQYSYTDAHAFEGRSFYRLKQTDIDGHYTYSDVKSVTIQSHQQVKILRANGTGSFTIAIAKPTRNMQIKIYDLEGTLLYSNVTVNQLNTISLSNHAKGMYLVEVMEGKEKIAVKKIIN